MNYKYVTHNFIGQKITEKSVVFGNFFEIVLPCRTLVNNYSKRDNSKEMSER